VSKEATLGLAERLEELGQALGEREASQAFLVASEDVEAAVRVLHRELLAGAFVLP